MIEAVHSAIFLQLTKGVDGYFSSYIRVIDLVLAFFIIWGAYKGFKRGFIVEIISLITFLLLIYGVFFAITVLFNKADQSTFNTPKGIRFGTFFLFFVIISLALKTFGRIIQNKIDYSVFDDFDNYMAMILGGLKYATFMSILLGLLKAIGFEFSQEIVSDTHLYPLLIAYQDWLVGAGATIAPTIGTIHEDMLRMLK
ncbi:MAG: CvpA family protein [Flammeovirgaceae bacterium]|nr:CvpA family protein [Flammeovirgaceae bacterium]